MLLPPPPPPLFASPMRRLTVWGDALTPNDRAVFYCRNAFHGRKAVAGSSASLAARSLYHSRPYRYLHLVVTVLYM